MNGIELESGQATVSEDYWNEIEEDLRIIEK